MGFAKDIQDLQPKIKMLMEASKKITPELVMNVNKATELDINELRAAVKMTQLLSTCGEKLEAVSNHIPEIKTVARMSDVLEKVESMENNIEHVLQHSTSIHKAVEMKSYVKDLLLNKEYFIKAIDMREELRLVLKLEEKMDAILAIESRLDDKLKEMKELEIQASNSSLLAVDMLNKINVKEKIINESMETISGYRADMVDFNIDTSYVPFGSDSFSQYDPGTNTLTLNIREGSPGVQGQPGNDGAVGQPGTAVHKGDKGEKGNEGAVGKDLHIDIMGSLWERKKYGNRPVGTTFLALDGSVPMLYFRKSNTMNDWTDGVPFGSTKIKHADSATNAEKMMGMTLAQLKNYIIQ